MRHALLLVICFLVRTSINAQVSNPPADDVFRPEEVAVIRITMSADDKAFLLHPDNIESETYLQAIFEMTNSRMDTALVQPVGIRLRGNTSRWHNKKPFKIDFREFDGEKFFGYKKFNLKPNTNDPSHFREPLTLQYYREMGVPAARTHPTEVYINDEYMGIYTNVEQIDDEFLNLRYGHEEGFLYKCSYGASLEDDGQVFNAAIFESEINEEDDTRSELDHFVDILNNSSDDAFVSSIESVFEVDLYLRQLAVESVLGHWDGYSFNQNNFYLFYNGQSGKFEFFPYDADNTWGIDWVDIDWATRDLNAWGSDDARPLTQRILDVPAYREQYIAYVKALFRDYFNEGYLMPLLTDYKEIVSDAVLNDSYFDDSFGFMHANFLNAFTEPADMDNHVQYGILEYLEARTESASQQVEGIITSVEDPFAGLVSFYPNPSELPRVYFERYESTSQPSVYSPTGAKIPVVVTERESGGIAVTLPPDMPKGLYLINVNNRTFRWMYK